MELRKGSRVLCPLGHGTVTDQADGESLVRMDEGDVLDVEHGRWWDDVSLAVIGFDPDAAVWFGSRMVLASTLL